MTINIKRILCPVDFSENAEHALDYALAFAQAHAAELILLHVIQTPWMAVPSDPMLPEFSGEVLAEYSSTCKQQLDELAAQTRQQYDRVTSLCDGGIPFIEIIRVAREKHVDLIVMGTHGRTGLAHVMIGSSAEKVVRKAPCPVLTVKHPEHEFVMP